MKAFLRDVLSREGQGDVVQEGEYLPLASAAAGMQLRELERQ